MRDTIFQYLMTQKGMTPKIAGNICEKMERHPDIMKEFAGYIEADAFPAEDAIVVEGYTAQQIFETTYLQPTGAYNYLISLRETPERAVSQLKKGLPRR